MTDLAIPDIARMARAFTDMGAIAERTAIPAQFVRNTEKTGIQNARSLSELADRLAAAADRGEVTNADAAIGALRFAAGRTTELTPVIVAATQKHGFGPWTRFDARTSSPHFRELATVVESAADELARVGGTRRIDPATSPVVATQPRAALATAPTNNLLPPLNSTWQLRVGQLFDALKGNSFEQRMIGAEHLAPPRAGEVGHIYTGSHRSVFDGFVLAKELRDAGVEQLHIVAAKPMAGRAGIDRIGVLDAGARDASGTRTIQRVVPEVLSAGRSVEMYPEGRVHAIGAEVVGEHFSGATDFAIATGARIVPSATVGLQSKALIGDHARGHLVQTVVGRPIAFNPVPAGADDTTRVAWHAEAREVLNQVHEQLQRRAAAAYRA